MNFSMSSKSRGVTLIEVLIAASLVSLISFVLYSSFSMGLKVWERSRRLLVEEDITVFFDKISCDLRNAFFYSRIKFEGNTCRLSFPSIVYTPMDAKIASLKDEYTDQVGGVTYYYDNVIDGIYRRQANYSQALNAEFVQPRLIVRSVDGMKFRYCYLTAEGEIFSKKILDTIPFGVEVEVMFSDNYGQRVIRKFINIPVAAGSL